MRFEETYTGEVEVRLYGETLTNLKKGGIMFGLKQKVKADEMEEVRQEIKNLRLAKQKISEEMEMLKLKKRLEQEEITHMVKINNEKKDQEVTSRKLELEKQHHEKISAFREEQTASLLQLNKELHGKMEARFNSELGNLKEIYKGIMGKMPDVTLALTKKL